MKIKVRVEAKEQRPTEMRAEVRNSGRKFMRFKFKKDGGMEGEKWALCFELNSRDGKV